MAEIDIFMSSEERSAAQIVDAAIKAEQATVTCPTVRTHPGIVAHRRRRPRR